MKSLRKREKPVTDMGKLAQSAADACDLLKALANENRLLLLCLLAEGEKSVTELEGMLQLRQPTVSQQLARLRADGLVATRRDGKAIYYSISSEQARLVMDLLHTMFCEDSAATGGRRRAPASLAAE